MFYKIKNKNIAKYLKNNNLNYQKIYLQKIFNNKINDTNLKKIYKKPGKIYF